jgi:tetratricopeptide (TPR) repeat protein
MGGRDGDISVLALPRAIQQAENAFNNGDWSRAELLCRSILSAQPGCTDALNLLGIITAQTQRTEEAGDLLRRAIAADPDNASVHNNYGNVLRRLKRFGDALRSYDRALEIKPDYAEAYFNRGNVLREVSRLEEAVDSYQQALRVKPDYAEAFFSRGNTLQELGRFADALDSYERALQIKPESAETYNNRGVTLRKLGRLEESLESYRRALTIRSDYADAYFNRAITLQELKRHADALDSYERALQIAPDAVAYNNRGNTLQELGRFEDALDSYERALRLKPDYADAYFNRGNALKALRRFAEALYSYERTLQLKPDHADACCNRGNALLKLGRFTDALDSYEQALQIEPGSADAHSNRGNALRALGRYDEALQSYERALQLKPDFAEAYSNLGVWHHERYAPEAAIANFNRAIDIRPDLAAAYMNRGYAALLAGDFAKGWSDYEWRWKAHPHSADPRYPDRTLWLGRESLSGKVIVLHSEQGLGDTLHFCRYVKLVAELGATVILEAASQLAALLANLEGLSQLVMRGEPLPAFDYHCPLMSLPLAFRTSLSTIPAQVPYIVSDSVKTRLWKEKLGPRTKPRVGLVWSGGFRPDQPEVWPVNSRRNIPLAKLAPLRNADISFYSLQKGQPAESELTALKAAGWPGPDLTDFTQSLQDFADSAALIENLDLVISVDTSIAHLAGALAKPVWIMNRFDNCWRWLMDRTDSPWYPTARLYRQRHPGEWDEVVERVRIDLFRKLN